MHQNPTENTLGDWGQFQTVKWQGVTSRQSTRGVSSIPPCCMAAGSPCRITHDYEVVRGDSKRQPFNTGDIRATLNRKIKRARSVCFINYQQFCGVEGCYLLSDTKKYLLKDGTWNQTRYVRHGARKESEEYRGVFLFPFDKSASVVDMMQGPILVKFTDIRQHASASSSWRNIHVFGRAPMTACGSETLSPSS